MKRAPSILFLVLATALTLAACGKKGNPKPPTKQQEQAEEPVSE